MGTGRQPTFDTLLRQFRTAAGLSQEELAERSGLSARAISDLERGARQAPYTHTVQQLARALALSDADATALEAAVDRRRRPRASSPARNTDTSNDLPVPVTRLIGRESAVGTLCALLERPTLRLLTLTGPGGVGKTRLALAVAGTMRDRFPDGTYFVSLAAITDPAMVIPTLAVVLGLREQPDDDPIFDRITAAMGKNQTLIVLDNFEHLLDAAPPIARLLAACPNLHVLVTSRSPLNLSGEQEWPVPPLALPDDVPHLTPQAVMSTPAVALFVEHASRVAPDFALTRANMHAVIAICRRIDGLPLAIELAASHVKVLPPRTLLARMEHRLGLLTGGVRDLPMRQQTMRATIGWSYALLGAEERRVLAHLATFANGWTMDAADAVCPIGSPMAMLEMLRALVDKSLALTIASGDGEPRFRMLETIREFALEQLSAGETEAAYERQAAYFLSLAERAEIEIRGPDQASWLHCLEHEHDNLRAILQWALTRGEWAVGTELAGSLWPFWHLHGHLSEGRQWLHRFLMGENGQPGVSAALRGKALMGAGTLAVYQADYPVASACYEEALALVREHGDPASVAQALGRLGLVTYHRGEIAQAKQLYEECLAVFRQSNDLPGIANTLNNLGVLARVQGDYPHARRLHEEGLVLQQTIGDVRGIAQALGNLGLVAHEEGDLTRAATLIEESLTLQRQLNATRAIAYSLTSLGWVVLDQGDCPRASKLFTQSLEMQRDVQDKAGIVECLEGMAGVANSEGHATHAARLIHAAAAVRTAIAAPLAVSSQAISVNRLVNAVRAALGDEPFAQESAVGAAMSLEEAIAAALRFTPGQQLRTVTPLRIVRDS